MNSHQSDQHDPVPGSPDDQQEAIQLIQEILSHGPVLVPSRAEISIANTSKLIDLFSSFHPMLIQSLSKMDIEHNRKVFGILHSEITSLIDPKNNPGSPEQAENARQIIQSAYELTNNQNVIIEITGLIGRLKEQGKQNKGLTSLQHDSLAIDRLIVFMSEPIYHQKKIMPLEFAERIISAFSRIDPTIRTYQLSTTDRAHNEAVFNDLYSQVKSTLEDGHPEDISPNQRIACQKLAEFCKSAQDPEMGKAVCSYLKAWRPRYLEYEIEGVRAEREARHAARAAKKQADPFSRLSPPSAFPTRPSSASSDILEVPPKMPEKLRPITPSSPAAESQSSFSLPPTPSSARKSKIPIACFKSSPKHREKLVPGAAIFSDEEKKTPEHPTPFLPRLR